MKSCTDYTLLTNCVLNQSSYLIFPIRAFLPGTSECIIQFGTKINVHAHPRLVDVSLLLHSDSNE